MSPKENLIFLKKRHVKYFKFCLSVLPHSTVAFDTSRMTALFFALSGLDLLNSLHEIDEKEKVNIIKWIYSMQVIPTTGSNSGGGFRGGSCLYGLSLNSKGEDFNFFNNLDCGHITMTYSALASLLLLGDDLSQVDKKSIGKHIASLQTPDGSFFATYGGSEIDLRFTYCAAAICYILNDFSSIDINAAVNYILATSSYEGALGQGQYSEAHGGSTYCGIASLYLMDKLDSFPHDKRERLVKWLISRQSLEGGLTGRPNKPPDTCYTFWVGASLKILGNMEYLDQESLAQFVLSTQDAITGGLGKYKDSGPDGLHSYLGISGLSLLTKVDHLDLCSVDPGLNISKRALKHLHFLHKQWTST